MKTKHIYINYVAQNIHVKKHDCKVFRAGA